MMDKNSDLHCEKCGKRLEHEWQAFGLPGETVCWKCDQHYNRLPEVKLFPALVVTCRTCGKWVARIPEYLEGDDWWCQHCGSGNLKYRRGRPFGPKSKQWRELVQQFESLFIENPADYFDSVVCDPPIDELIEVENNLYKQVTFVIRAETKAVSNDPR